MPAGGVRRSGRIPKQIAIILSGSDTEGKGFSEETKTLVLSRHGASVLSQHKLVPEQEMFIRSLETNKEVEVRMVGEIGQREDGYIYGVAFVDPNINFWEMEFPPPTAPEKAPSSIWLECSGCHTREAANLDALEQDVYAVNQGIVRYCKRCLLQTIWKQVRGVVAGEPVAPPPPPPPPPEPKPEVLAEASPAPAAPATRPENRRREVRAKVNLKACIRYSGIEEVVACENMSRGGVCFLSRKQYPVESRIEIAVPYSPGGQSIFVPALIAHVQELPKEKLYRCGVAYVKATRNPDQF
jgi:hypothetical protein